MKKVYLGLLTIALGLSVIGCGSDSDNKNIEVEKQTLVSESESVTEATTEATTKATTETITEVTTEAETSDDTETAIDTAEATSLEYVRNEMKAANMKCAVAYVEFTHRDDEESIMGIAGNSSLAKNFAFVKSISGDNVVNAGGYEIYCIVPEIGSSVVINKMELVDDDVKPTDVIYTGDDKPILLLANISDIWCSSIVYITTATGEVIEYSPSLSLKDGTLSSSDGIFDFSIYNN